MRLTFSLFKGDVGSKGGHTLPAPEMLAHARERAQGRMNDGMFIDAYVGHVGDDIHLHLTHPQGQDSRAVHDFVFQVFQEMTEIAKRLGLYGAGQDILVDASSGNIRGTGLASAEIEWEHDFSQKNRPAETIIVFFADKSAPGGVFNMPLWNIFFNSSMNTSLILKSELNAGFSLDIIDMDYKGGDRIVRLNAPEDIWNAHALLLEHDRYAVKSVWSRFDPSMKLGAGTAERLHNIAGKYTGKDDPAFVGRTQGIFPAPEFWVIPFQIAHFLEGNGMGSHVLSLMPMPLNSSVSGMMCQPIVQCYVASVDAQGRFVHTVTDYFGGLEWDSVRQKALLKSQLLREQGSFGIAMTSQAELAYTGRDKVLSQLKERFQVFPAAPTAKD